MNLEEARNNIGAEVELDESTKPYTYKSHFSKRDCEKSPNPEDGRTYIIDEIRGNGNVCIKGDFYEDIHPRHLKLKLQNYKIHVPTEGENKEAQRLFFELGYGWAYSGKTLWMEYLPYLYAFSNGYLGFNRQTEDNHFNCHINKQITLQDLREMVAKKKCEDETLRVTGTIQNFEPHKEMTWEDALRAVADGKDVEYFDWHSNKWKEVETVRVDRLGKFKVKFRLAPKRIYLNGEYTKEELLQKIGEME